MNRSTDSLKRDKRTENNLNTNQSNLQKSFSNTLIKSKNTPPSVNRNLKPQSTYDIPKSIDTNSMKRKVIPKSNNTHGNVNDDDVAGSLHDTVQVSFLFKL